MSETAGQFAQAAADLCGHEWAQTDGACVDCTEKAIAAAEERGRRAEHDRAQGVIHVLHQCIRGKCACEDNGAYSQFACEETARKAIDAWTDLAPRDSGTVCTCPSGIWSGHVDGCALHARGSQMTPPDSGEREVCGAVIARVNGDPLRCEMVRGHDGGHEAKLAGPIAAHGAVLLPQPLAQRILAALETNDGWTLRQQVAAELRAAVERKP